MPHGPKGRVSDFSKPNRFPEYRKPAELAKRNTPDTDNGEPPATNARLAWCVDEQSIVYPAQSSRPHLAARENLPHW